MRFVTRILPLVALAAGLVAAQPAAAKKDRDGGYAVPAHGGYWVDPAPRWVPARPRYYRPRVYYPPPVVYAPPPPVYYVPPPRYYYPPPPRPSVGLYFGF